MCLLYSLSEVDSQEYCGKFARRAGAGWKNGGTGCRGWCYVALAATLIRHHPTGGSPLRGKPLWRFVQSPLPRRKRRALNGAVGRFDSGAPHRALTPAGLYLRYSLHRLTAVGGGLSREGLAALRAAGRRWTTGPAGVRQPGTEKAAWF